MSWETILPETIKAASSPITKLIEVVSAGCGKLYEPAHIRRVAKAEADALLLLAGGGEAVTDLQLRAASRRVQTEERRQENIEAIIGHAASELSPNEEISSQSVSSDWSARFFKECEDVGDDKMRLVWGKILAGEIKSPQSFSQRTLSILKNISTEEAQLFNTLCKYSFHVYGRDIVVPMDLPWSEDFWISKGITFRSTNELVSAGLVTHHALGLTMSKVKKLLLQGSKSSVYLTAENPGDLPMGSTTLTSAGFELSRICEWNTEERVDAVIKNTGAPFNPQKVEILTEADGAISFRDV